MPSPQDVDEQHGLDPFLIAHRAGNGVFNMSGKYSPAAVRDQINRAVALVERTWLVGLLHSRSRLLVKGGGAAGISAVMQAVNRGVADVTLSHPAGKPFFERQHRSSRIIDPVEYDWPAPGWDGGDNLPTGRVPLPYSRGRARDVVAKQWNPAWEAFKARGKINATLKLVPPPTVAATPAGAFDLILDCTGPGAEVTTVGKYTWYQFWENDPLELPNLGRATPPRVLISGGADGALQDFLRICFPGLTPRDIYKALELTPDQRMQVEWPLLNAEDRARRAWVWSAHPGIDCGILRQLHQQHREVAAKLLPAVRKRLEQLLQKSTTKLENLFLAHGCDHFSPCYAFNRFLVLLVDEFCKETAGLGSRLLPGRKLTALTGHDCHGEIEDCLEHPHTPVFGKSHCRLAERNTAPEPPASDPFDVIIVRHGLNAQTRRLSRQSLPYELPELP